MSRTHTNGPIGPITIGRKVATALYLASGEPVCQVDSMGELSREAEIANARRMAAAWNVCQFTTTAALEEHREHLQHHLSQALPQRAQCFEVTTHTCRQIAEGAKGTVYIESYEAYPATVVYTSIGSPWGPDWISVQRDAVSPDHTFHANIAGRIQFFRRHRHIQWVAMEPEAETMRAAKFVPGPQRFFDLAIPF